MRTALTTSGAPQSLETNPEAPAAVATARETVPGAGDQQHPGLRRARLELLRSARRPTGCRGRGRRGRRRAAAARRARAPRSAVAAPAQRSTQGWRSSSRRKPQWTTSWSSTTRTRSERSRPFAAAAGAAHRWSPTDHAHVPAPARQRAELDQGVLLQRLERQQAQAEPGAGGRRSACSVDAVVGDLELERRPRARATRTSIRVARCACFSQLRSASRKTDWASGSSRSGTSTGARPVERRARACARRGGRTAPSSVVDGGPPVRGDRPAERRAQVGERRLELVVAGLALSRRSAAGRSRARASRPKSRCITRSWISRVSSIRSSSWRARSSWRVARSTLAASAASRPSVSIVWQLLGGRARSARRPGRRRSRRASARRRRPGRRRAS